MEKIKLGDIIKTSVVGIQHYGIFVSCLDDTSYTGLIHISEITTEFVSDINRYAKLDDIIYAKVIDIDYNTKHVKLSIKATQPKNRTYSSTYTNDDECKKADFTPLKEKLNEWIQIQLKEKRK